MPQQPPSASKNYAGFSIERVKILTVRPTSLIVRLENGSKASVPKREWSWDRRQRAQDFKWIEGTNHDAVIKPNETHAGLPVASFREVNDPWGAANAVLQVGKSVRAEIVHIRENFVFAQVEPGVAGIIYARDLPMLSAQQPQDVLSIGDVVYAKIVEADLERRNLRFSVTDWLRNIRIGTEEDQTRMNRLFRETIEGKHLPKKILAPKLEQEEIREFEVEPLTQDLHRVLVIDDNAEDRRNIANTLEQAFKVVPDMAITGKSGLDMLKNNPGYDLVIVDMGLSDDENGIEVARQILRMHPDIHLVFASRDVFRHAPVRFFEREVGRHFPFYPKPTIHPSDEPDEVLSDIIGHLQAGVVYHIKSMVANNQGAFIEQLDMAPLLTDTLEGSLTEVLKNLVKATFVDSAVVLELDSEQETFQLVAAYPPQRMHQFHEGLDGMYYSQAREVIEDAEMVYATEITPEQKRIRYKNFFSGMDYTCFYAMPIKQQGYPVRYGLFVLDKKKDLPWDTILQIRNSVHSSSLLLDRNMMLRFMALYEDRYFKGQMFGTFIHELRNFMESVQGSISTAKNERTTEGKQRKLEEIEQAYGELLSLTNSYNRLIKDEMDATDLNALVDLVVRQLQYNADDDGIKIVTDFDWLMPELWINPSRVEQIVRNIVLNAVQHTAILNNYLNHLNQVQPHELNLRAGRTVWVKTQYDEKEQRCYVLVLDTGSGVPYHKRTDIFQAGVSLRDEGNGLGLFISRNLAEALQGGLILAETVRFGGSAFVISLPVVAL